MAPRTGLRFFPRSDLRPDVLGSEVAASAGTASAVLTVSNPAPIGSQATAQSGVAVIPGGGGGANEPAHMTRLVRANWDAAAPGTVLQDTVPDTVYEGWSANTNANNFAYQLLSLQSTWRTAGTSPLPSDLSADDRVLVGTFNVGTSGDKGQLYCGLSGVRGLYQRRRFALTDNWVGHGQSTFKVATTSVTGGSYHVVLVLYGSPNSSVGSLRIRINTAGMTNKGACLPGFGTNSGDWRIATVPVVRNTTTDLEWRVEAQTSTGMASPDGEMAVYQNGAKVLHVGGLDFGFDTFGQVEQLLYNGGQGATTPATTQQFVADLGWLSTSTSKVAIP